MLNIKLSLMTPADVVEAITSMRRSHVSRFPVDVVSTDERPRTIRFIDTRFPTDRTHVDACLAILKFTDTDTSNRLIYEVTSRLIQNEKFAVRNPSYHMKQTTDLKKVVKMLREYAKPYSALEITKKFDSMEPSADYEMWVQSPRDQFNTLVHGLRSTDIAEEIIYLRSVGVQFRSEKFNKVASSGIELYEESKRRRDTKVAIMLVFIQPDNSVIVTTSSESDEANMPAGSWTYESMEAAPTCVQQQVAMLRMCDSMSYVPEVGRNAQEGNVFWIQVNPEDFKAQNS